MTFNLVKEKSKIDSLKTHFGLKSENITDNYINTVNKLWMLINNKTQLHLYRDI